MSKYLIAGLGITLILLFTHYKAYNTGIDVQKGIEAQARQDLIDNQQDEVKDVKKEDVKKEKKHHDRVKIIYKMADPTGCLDKSIGSIGLLPTPSTN